MFDQMLAGRRQSGKTNWLVERALRDVTNRESTSLIVVIGPNQAMTNQLVQTVRDFTRHPNLQVIEYHKPEKLRGHSFLCEHVVILADEIQLYSNDVLDKIQNIKESIIPGCSKAPTFYIYGTNNIGEEA